MDILCFEEAILNEYQKLKGTRREEMQACGEDTSVFVSGQEKSSETVKLARMNLAVNGMHGEILQGISYYDDHFGSFGKG